MWEISILHLIGVFWNLLSCGSLTRDNRTTLTFYFPSMQMLFAESSSSHWLKSTTRLPACIAYQFSHLRADFPMALLEVGHDIISGIACQILVIDSNFHFFSKNNSRGGLKNKRPRDALLLCAADDLLFKSWVGSIARRQQHFLVSVSLK